MADRDHLADLRTVAMSGVADIAARFKKPDADFMPAFFFVDGAGHPSIIGIDNYAPNEEQVEQGKRRLARFIESTLRRERALAASLMISAWTAPPPPGKTKEELLSGRYKASTLPGRREVLWLQVTDGERYEVWEADLIRHEGNPPTVGGWRNLAEEGDVKQSKGRFMLHDIFRRALGVRS